MSQSEITETPKSGEAPASKAAPAVGKDTGASKKAAKIGPSIVIHGDVAGEEDLIVDGTIEGTVNFKENHLIVSKNGRVTANINARVIRVDGEVKGELRASEQVSISPSGQVNGDIRAPRVVLEDGCQFKGSVDMESDKAAAAGDRARTPRLRPGGARPIRPGRDPGDVLRG